ncbi:transmembrane protein 207 [Elgaria multicarinata webbii]|uniref:transmembrane protein 207 n=1 Tax=Elgaria multicarinata webbii TaxID=159646 RepID=UPI002FCD1721
MTGKSRDHHHIADYNVPLEPEEQPQLRTPKRFPTNSPSSNVPVTFGAASVAHCIGYEEQSFSAWYIWFCVSLFLVAILSCAVVCCLQWWLKRRGLFPRAPRTLTVFALSDADSIYENDAALWTLPKIHPHLQNPDWDSSDSSFDMMVGSGPPPSYEEVMKQGSCSASGPTKGVVSDLPQ